MSVTREARIEKIQMLLALGQSDNPHESEVALAKAQQMMLAHKISANEVEAHKAQQENPMHKIIFRSPRKRRTMQDTYVIWLLNDFFGIKSVYCNYPSAIQYTFMGRKSDVEMAEYLYHFITRYFQVSWEAFCVANPKQGAGRRKDNKSFFLGCYRGIKSILSESKKKIYQDTQEKGLIIVDDDRALSAYMHECFPRLRSISEGPINNYSMDASSAGYEAGRKFSVTQGVSAGTTRNLLN